MEFKLDYYLTTDDRWLRNFSDALTEVTGYPIEIRNNNLIFHPAVGEGLFELTTFGDGLSLVKVDCVFHLDLKMSRSADPKNEEFIIHFNMSEKPIYASHGKANAWLDFSEAIHYSSSSLNLETSIRKGDHVKLLMLIADRRWMNTNITDKERAEANVLHQFLTNHYVQGILSMDLVDFNLAHEALATSLPVNASKLHTHGTTLNLLAHFFKKISIRQRVLEKGTTQEVEPFALLKDKLICQLHQPWPPLEALANEHNMSKTKFVQYFARIFGKNYSQFYLDARMEKAAKMISEGFSVSMTGMEVGYTNLGHFSKIFKRYYGMSPRQYAKSNELFVPQATVA